MHKYLFDSSRKRDMSLRHVEASSRREVVFQASQKRKKLSSSRQSPVLILTSSQPGSSEEPRFSLPALTMPAEEFYSKPKSLLEQQYERKVNEFVSLNQSDSFLPLESSPGPEKQDELQVAVDSPIEMPSQPKEALVLLDITPDLVKKSMQDADLQVGLLLHAAEKFLHLAHSIVLQCNDLSGSELYYSYIKLALKYLHILLKRYQPSLDPQLEAAIQMKLAEIYFTETENLDRAEKFVIASLAVTSRHNLDTQYIASDLLHYRILLARSDPILPNYFKERILYYASRKLNGALDIFSLLRAQWCLRAEPHLALNHLRSLNEGSSTESHVLVLGLLLEASLLMYRGDSLDAKPLLKAAATRISVIGGPPQLRGLHLLLTLTYYINVGGFQKGKDVSKELSKFIGRQKRSKWESWSANGQVTISVEITKGREVEIQFAIFNSEEFILLFYFLSGVLFTLSETSFHKAEKAYDTCLKMLDLRLQELTSNESNVSGFSTQNLCKIIIRLNSIRYSLLYYKTWLQIVANEDYSGIALIREFLRNFNDETFSDEELLNYRSVLDRFMYLNAIYHLSKGDIQGAKYHFMQVRERTSISNPTKMQTVLSLSQIDLNIGCEALLGKMNHNELHLYSSLHLLLICEYEMHLFSKNPEFSNIEHTNVHSCRSLLSTLHSELSSDFNQVTLSGVCASEKWLRLTFKVISLVLANKDLSASSLVFSEITDNHLLNDLHCPTYLKNILLYIKYQTSTKRDEKNLIAKKLSDCSSKSAFLNHLRFLVLSDNIKDFNHSDNQENMDTQIISLRDHLVRHGEALKLAHLSFKD